MKYRVIETGTKGCYRIVEHLPRQGRREYWVQFRFGGSEASDWQDVQGPWWQRPAALRRLKQNDES